ncbi:MAG: AAA family ATPase [Sumerlaeia bacterium]
MSTYTIPIRDLPTDITMDDAVEAVYGPDLDWVRDKLLLGLSVLIECDKQLVTFLYRALRARMRTHSGRNVRLNLLAGHATGGEGPMGGNATLMQRLLRQLQEAVFSGEEDQVLVLPHLDILTTTTRSGLSGETREAAALLYENAEAVFLAFKDPSFELPKVIENLFTARRSLIGIPRDRLRHLVTQREARKLAVEEFNPYQLYKYMSGLNAVRVRQILGHFADRMDYNPAMPQSADAIIREIRTMTVMGDVELPRVDLDSQIGGYKHVKKRIREDILDLLLAKEKTTDPAAIRHIEEIVPKGMIFYGPPGTGKTFFAKAIATAIDATIHIVSGPELKSKWVGESEENLRRVFAQARKSAPAIIVFDELDSFASSRGSFEGSGVEHSMVNQLLTEMDGFRKEEMVFVIGTTNFSEALDPALLRPGRFELDIEIPYPEEEDRKEILKIYREKFKLRMSDELLDDLAKRTAAFLDERRGIRHSGDHLFALCRALKREELRTGGGEPLEITEDHITAVLGGKKKDKELQEEEKVTVAVHEAGHAILAYVLPHCPTIEKVTISSEYEETLGYVMQAVRKKKYVITDAEFLDDICVLLGGRTAERLLIGPVSVGAYNDLQRANEIARVMVEELGMTHRLGPRTFPKVQETFSIFGSHDRRPVSEQTAQAIDEEITRILTDQADRAERLLAEHKDKLEGLRDVLLEKKSAGVKELKEMFGGVEFKA